jgi:hypothetical protein
MLASVRARCALNGNYAWMSKEVRAHCFFVAQFFCCAPPRQPRNLQTPTDTPLLVSPTKTHDDDTLSNNNTQKNRSAASCTR